MKKKLTQIFGKLIKNKPALYSATAAFVVVALVLLLGIYSAAYSRVLPNVFVGTVDVGRLTFAEAEKKILDNIGKTDEERSIIVECEEKSQKVALSQFEVEVDSFETAKSAFGIGRDSGVFGKALKLVSGMFSETVVEPVISVNEDRYEEIIRELSLGKETKHTETTYSLSGNELTITKGRAGKEVNREKALLMLRRAVGNKDTKKIVLEIEPAEPKPVDVEAFYNDMVQPTQDARYEYKDGEVVIIDERKQITVDKDKVIEALKSENAETTIDVKVKTPEVTADKLRALLFRDVMGEFSSNFSSSSAARASNVTLTAERINGYVLMPGDVFSYDKTVGERTYANGYKEAGVYVGNKVESGIGGGICQTSSTLYSAALYANLEIVSRKSHSLPVSYVPAGQDATIAQGYIDLLIKNNTEYPVKIVAEISGRNVACKILGVKPEGQTVEIINTRTAYYSPGVERVTDESVPKGYKMIQSNGAGGFAVASKRIVKQDGKVVKEENLTSSVYRASDTIEAVNPADKETPTEALKVYTEGMEIPEEKPEIEVGNGESGTKIPENIGETENSPLGTEENAEIVVEDVND